MASSQYTVLPKHITTPAVQQFFFWNQPLMFPFSFHTEHEQSLNVRAFFICLQTVFCLPFKIICEQFGYICFNQGKLTCFL